MDWVAKLARALAGGQGVRLGEAAVVSRRVHTVDPARPGIISVLSHLDAGVAFYGRSRENEIIHVDLFHQVGEVDHRRCAAGVAQVLAAAGRPELADYFDLQTGTGGGRVTGDLVYGRKPGLLASHRNHVHCAGLVPDGGLDLLGHLVAALEDIVVSAGLEIRRVDGLRHPAPAAGGPLDLSDYADQTDSLLRGAGAGGRGALRGGPAGSASGEGTMRSHGAAGGSGGGQGTAGGPGAYGRLGADGASGARGASGETDGAGTSGGTGAPASSGVPAAGWQVDEARLQSALNLSRRLGSPDEVKRVLDAVRSGTMTGGLTGGLLGGSSQAPFVLRELEDEGLIRRDGRGVRLTDAGRALSQYLDQHLREVKLRFRKLIRCIPRRALADRPRVGDRPSAEVRYGPVRGAAPSPAGGWLGDLAVPETVVAGIRRAHLERTAGRPFPGLRVERQDIHVHLRSGDQPLYICLLIDASASMAGRRILAAKHLARHLLVSTRDRVAVVGFQERDVRVHVPFSRDYTLVEEGLSRIQPMGLTPLAHGLVASLDLIRASRVRRPLLLLITDGIPTVPRWTIDPLADALEAARRIAASRVPFGCIGLMPSRRYLEELARAAGGTLHVVDELHEDALVSIAHRERQRQLGRR